MNSPLPVARPIREFDKVDRSRFLDELQSLGEPFVVRGLADGWPAVRAARESDEALVEYLCRYSTVEPVDMVVGRPEIEGRFAYTEDLQGLNFVRGRSPVRAFFERLLRDREESRPYAMAMQSAVIPTVLPGFELENSLDLPPVAVAPRIWVGNAICVATHADPSENLAVNVAGHRRFTLFPPEAMSDLYIGPVEFTPAGPLTSLVHVTRPDLERFPRFAQAMAQAQQADLSAGDALYIPFHWWHHVQSLDRINVLVNYWWADSAHIQLPSPLSTSLLAMLTLRSLPPQQQRAFLALIRHYVTDEAEPGSHIPTQARGILGSPGPKEVAGFRRALREALSD
jgi:hypothetical protein